jgi:hypothetical protein
MFLSHPWNQFALIGLGGTPHSLPSAHDEPASRLSANIARQISRQAKKTEMEAGCGLRITSGGADVSTGGPDPPAGYRL